MQMLHLGHCNEASTLKLHAIGIRKNPYVFGVGGDVIRCLAIVRTLCEPQPYRVAVGRRVVIGAAFETEIKRLHPQLGNNMLQVGPWRNCSYQKEALQLEQMHLFAQLLSTLMTISQPSVGGDGTDDGSTGTPAEVAPGPTAEPAAADPEADAAEGGCPPAGVEGDEAPTTGLPLCPGQNLSCGCDRTYSRKTSTTYLCLTAGVLR